MPALTRLLALSYLTVAMTALGPVVASAQAPAPIHLFNGKDLSNFHTWLVNDHRADPDRVFTVVPDIDGASAIRISGQTFGGITTEQEFTSYRLTVEFRWGTQTWPPRVSRARDSGVLVHCQGADGNTGATFNGPWMQSIEAQIIEGGIGDFLMVAGHDAGGTRRWPEMTATISTDRDGEWVYDPKGTPRVHRNGDRINWWGRDPDWTDRLGYRGARDVERPAGEWNRLEIVVEPDRITNILNDVVVNVGTAPTLSRGRIMIQSEGAEIFVRRVDLRPLPIP